MSVIGDLYMAWRAQLGARAEAARALRAQAAESFGYDAARRDVGDRWAPVTAGPNAIATRDGLLTRAASRDAERNNPLARRIIDILPSYVVSTGFRPRLREDEIGEARAARQMAAWRRFVAYADPEGVWNFHASARLAFSTTVQSGYALLRWYPGGSVDAPLHCRVLEPDFLDASKTSFDLADGGYTLNGIEFDGEGRRRAYWLYDRHPGETGLALSRPESARVPADEVDMLWLPRRPGEIVPVTWLSAAMETLRDRRDYLTSERVRAKMQACIALIANGVRPGALDSLSKSGAGGASAVGGGASEPLRDAQGRVVESMRPGMIGYLQGGEITAFEPRGVVGTKDFVWVADHDIGTSVGMPHFMLTGNYSGVNFSSAQLGLLQFLTMLDVWQDAVEQLVYARAWRRCMEAEARLGRAPRVPDAPVWAWPRKHIADIVKQMEAILGPIDAGLDSAIAAIEARGDDPAEVIAQRRRWREMERRAGLAGAADEPGQPEGGNDGAQ